MIDELQVLAVIIARGGSKGLPGKNLLPLAGKPLLAWTIEAAHGAALVDRTILSSDDKEIVEEARRRNADVPFVRPRHLATDDATAEDVLIHAIVTVGGCYDYAVLLQATSPLRRSEDIDGAIRHCHEAGATACVAVTPVAKPPQWMVHLDAQGRTHTILDDDRLVTRRQEAPQAFVFNGAVYVVQTAPFLRSRTIHGEDTVAYVMPPERSVDVDNQFDLWLAETCLRHEAGPGPGVRTSKRDNPPDGRVY